MKKAFTFAELMISLVVIAIITAILYPTIADLAPNNNEQLFRNTYKTIELTIADIVGSTADGKVPTAANDLCKEFADRLNTVKHKKADGTASASDCATDENLIQTSNGVRWLFADGGIIYVDVNSSNNKIVAKCDTEATGNYCASIDTLATGKDSASKYLGYFVTGNSTSQDTFKITVTEDGKVTPYDSVAIMHLRGDNAD